MRIHNHNFFALVLMISAVPLLSCNLTSWRDKATTKEELLEKGKAEMDEGKYSDAASTFNSIVDKDDTVYYNLGWAYLGDAGATIAKVGSTLMKYDSTSNNLTVIGALANQLVPSNSTKVSKVAEGITAFNSMSTGNARSANVALGTLVKAAAIVAKASGDNSRVVRADIAPSNCINDCTTAGTNCTAVRLSNTDANELTTTLNDAATAVSGLNALGIAKDLAERLGASDFNTADSTRCTVFYNMLTE